MCAPCLWAASLLLLQDGTAVVGDTATGGDTMLEVLRRDLRADNDDYADPTPAPAPPVPHRRAAVSVTLFKAPATGNSSVRHSANTVTARATTSVTTAATRASPAAGDLVPPLVTDKRNRDVHAPPANRRPHTASATAPATPPHTITEYKKSRSSRMRARPPPPRAEAGTRSQVDDGAALALGADNNVKSGEAAPPPAELLDLAPAKGSRVESKRSKGRLCDRSVLVPEGPKYDSTGRAYLPPHEPRRPYSTRRPRHLLPRCCNCCRKSVLGCE